MGLADFILRRSLAYKLRKNYDRLREKADRLPQIERRMEILRLLDRLDPSIISLEEHHMSRFEKKRIASHVKADLNKIKYMMDKQEKQVKETYLR